MANIRSAEKQNRKRSKRQAQNMAQKSAMRTAVKKVRAAVAAKDPGRAVTLLKPAVSLLSRLGRRGVIKRHAASRSVSRLTLAVRRLGK